MHRPAAEVHQSKSEDLTIPCRALRHIRKTKAWSQNMKVELVSPDSDPEPRHWVRHGKSTGETPHQFVLRQRLERAKEMLRAQDARVLDVAVACGFKTQQHFAQVFRDVYRVSPTEYRQDFLDSEVIRASETHSEDTLRL